MYLYLTSFSIDATGNLYFVQSEALYKVPPSGPVGVVANVPDDRTSVVFDPSGNLYVADQQRLRLIEASGAASCTPSLLPYIPLGGIVNAASYSLTNSGLAPGTLVTIFGQLVGPATPAGGVVESGKFQTSAGGTQVWINDTPAPVIYASATQTTAIIPFDASENEYASVQLSVNGFLSNRTYVQLADAAPGIFTQDASGKGAGSILNQDYSINSPSNPADKGSVVMVYLTGLGALEPALADGELAPGASQHTVQFQAQIDSSAADIVYQGTSPGLVAGVSQVNVRIPGDVDSGARTLTISGPKYGQGSQPVTIYIR